MKCISSALCFRLLKALFAVRLVTETGWSGSSQETLFRAALNSGWIVKVFWAESIDNDWFIVSFVGNLAVSVGHSHDSRSSTLA